MKLLYRPHIRQTIVKGLVCILLVGFSFGFYAQTVHALSLTSISDVLSRLKDTTAANHEIKFVTPATGGVAAGESIILTFTGFTGVSSLDYLDVDFASGNTNDCATATFTEKTLAAAPSGATWGLTTSGSAVTLLSGTDTVTADRCVRFRLGTNAVTPTTGDTQIVNGTAATVHSVAITGSFGDTGTLAVDIITDDQVAITATVDPTISFSISDNTTEFGTLTTGAARWADNAAGNGSAVASHDFQVATNATSGYSITYFGATLTSGGNTIDPATITADSDGVPGTEQFALALNRTTGNGTTDTAYAFTSNNYKFVASTTSSVYSETVATNNEIVDVYYLANIGGATEAGAYSTTITWIATGTF